MHKMNCDDCIDHRIPSENEEDEESGDDESTVSTLRPQWRDRQISKSRSAFSGLIVPNEYAEDEDTSDSDAEFKVHSVLRGMTKTNSAYAFPEGARKIRGKRTDFELNLDRMLQSMERSAIKESEPEVANFAGKLDNIWPEPDEPRKKDKNVKAKEESMETSTSPRMSACWSSPPNVYLEERSGATTPDSDNGSAYCWSAPEFLVEDDSDNSDYCDYQRKRIVYGRKPAGFWTSYPEIETPDDEPSIASIRLPSSGSSRVNSPSPPRPLSPVFGHPPREVPRRRLPVSRSLQAEHLHTAASLPSQHPHHRRRVSASPLSDSEEESRGEEVWPESDVVYRDRRLGWDSHGLDTYRIPRSRSAYHRLPSPEYMVSHSLSAHSHLCNLPEMIGSTCASDAQSSAHSQLNANEREEMEERQQWMERGSSVRLGSRTEEEIWQLRDDFGYPYRQRQPMYGLREMRRSVTVEEGLRRANPHQHSSQQRRRLPRRPDGRVIGGIEEYADLPCSVSMYGRLLRDETSDYSPQYDYTVNSSGRNMGSSHSFSDIQRDYHNPPVETMPPVEYRTRQRTEWMPTYGGSIHDLENEPPVEVVRQDRPPDLSLRSTLVTQVPNGAVRSPLIPLRRDPYADIETPMSPPLHVLPSPALSSTGRRLPPLPVRNSFLDSLPTMSHITQPSHSAGGQPKEDHRLCFGMESLMGRSTLDDSYYEEDGMNGNNTFGEQRRGRKSFFSAEDSSGVSSCTGSESLNPTHRVQSSFIPRHNDEILLEIGDAVHIDRTCEDHWCYGTNLRTGQHGIFPSAVVCEIDLVEEICMGALPTNTQRIMTEDRDTFYLTLLGSIEVAHHKGNDVLTQAINKMLNLYKNKEEVIVPQTVLMEISFRGIHVIDKRKKNFFQCPSFDFFYSLQNISFCGAHPKQLKYFGFITKHPLLPRFACHVFLSNGSTQPIVESIGRAFKRSYDEYMAFAHPTEDIYLE